MQRIKPTPTPDLERHALLLDLVAQRLYGGDCQGERAAIYNFAVWTEDPSRTLTELVSTAVGLCAQLMTRGTDDIRAAHAWIADVLLCVDVESAFDEPTDENA